MNADESKPFEPKRPRLHLAIKEEDGFETNKENNSQDEEYFKSYADISIHEEMLSDAVRTNAYRYAILKNYEKIRGKIVADIGAGTGILSVFCVQAGAKKVFAIEASSMAEQTESIVKENKLSNRITVINKKAEDVAYPEKLDAIVSEWMGYCLLYESMLQSVIDTRDKWLKKEGLMFPATATLYIAAYNDEEYDARLDIWNEFKSMYKVSMESMKKCSKKCISRNVKVRSVPPMSIMSHGQTVCSIDLKTVTVQDLHNIKKQFKLECFGRSTIHGFITWFTVTFPGDITLSTSPYSEDTHWGQTIFYLEEPFDVDQGTLITGEFSLCPNNFKSRFLDININYRVNNGPETKKYYYMNDFIT
ncbi:protein arginine N-methyltransferase 6-like [Mytilus galloprovincialis]|uniref:protein arginine N-methyltransferase 6-like n=1 Tax=Mytilus galloprovincialis TaxID=29158 RepID=UPI003F7BAF89